ncbi:MAG: hypothetical protein Greene071421_12 [Parcubacteria group bacterium Greene0714_21]|nr:MAG: hypothetical protein Greene041639_410 [Parcubacteria group bacterium Greene0416_39]TSC97957.1 MAG: hypothetical protein Greene101447_255 [Parcubacteria group bacterium Greene1014_47]TSD04526.1 MAG: hypothetical protein Greene071421_12 [Parcubacteria group bacterium Greene0714_21]
MTRKKLPLILAVPIKKKGGLAEFKVSKLLSSPEIFLQKLVSKARIFSMKAEAKTSDWLVSLRKKSQEKNGRFSSNYWNKLKKKG